MKPKLLATFTLGEEARRYRIVDTGMLVMEVQSQDSMEDPCWEIFRPGVSILNQAGKDWLRVSVATEVPVAEMQDARILHLPPFNDHPKAVVVSAMSKDFRCQNELFFFGIYQSFPGVKGAQIKEVSESAASNLILRALVEMFKESV